jgi:hypothetical protein
VSFRPALAGDGISDAGREGDSAVAKIYRDIVIEQMVLTVEEAMSRVIDWWGDLPPSMKEAIDEFRAQVGAAIDSVEFVKRALDTQPRKLTARKVSLSLSRWIARNFDERT